MQFRGKHEKANSPKINSIVFHTARFNTLGAEVSVVTETNKNGTKHGYTGEINQPFHE